MTRATAVPAFPPFPGHPLDRALTVRERATIDDTLTRLLAFQDTLEGWPPIPAMPDATPFVSLYLRGAIVGCFGSHDPVIARRLPRAVLSAAHDARFGAVSDGDRARLRAQVSFPCRARLVNPHGVERELEVGTHGLAMVQMHGASTVLLPDVARDDRLDPRGMLTALERKSGVAPEMVDGALYVFETERLVAGLPETTDADPLELARGWLASLVAADGSVAFEVDARTGARGGEGVMMHGRVAVAVQALATSARHRAEVDRARRWLATTIRAGLAGERVASWPEDPATVAGTLALAVRAGVPLREELAAHVAEHASSIARVPWHAAQVVSAHPESASVLLPPCVDDLERRPWAPWTLLAADAAGDREIVLRVAKTVVEGIRKEAPHRGGASGPAVPELALTALAVEALRVVRTPSARAACERGRAFLRAWQLLGPRLHAGLDVAAVLGAFPASPVADVLRCDITGHAVLALAGG